MLPSRVLNPLGRWRLTACRLHCHGLPRKGRVLDLRTAVKDIVDGSRLLVGGHGARGMPAELLAGVLESRVKGLTVVCGDAGHEEPVFKELVKVGRVKRVVTSSIANNEELARMYFAGEIEVQIIPQGTLAECLRAGGSGIPAFYTAVGTGTAVEDGGLPIRYSPGNVPHTVAENPVNVEWLTRPRLRTTFADREYILEEAIAGDFALVRAWRADTDGNLCFRGARDFSAVMCRAARVTIALVDEVVPVGHVAGENVHVSAIYVDRVVKARWRREREKTERAAGRTESTVEEAAAVVGRRRILRRVAVEMEHNTYVNVGPGLAMAALAYVPPGVRVTVVGEGGEVRGLAGRRKEDFPLAVHTTYWGCDETYAMMRGGHLTLVVAEATEVSQYGDVACSNNSVPDAHGHQHDGIGNTMDRAAAPTRFVAAMTHVGPSGRNKIVEACSRPVAGRRCVDLIVTDKAVFKVHPEEGLTLVEVAEGVEVEDVVLSTGCVFKMADQVKVMQQVPITESPASEGPCERGGQDD